VEGNHDGVGAALAQQRIEPLGRLDVRDRVRRDCENGSASGDFHLICPLPVLRPRSRVLPTRLPESGS
jgi:hypothetical protein